MRKVKISLVTKEQREAREQGKVAAKPTTGRPAKTTTARAPKAKLASKSTPPLAKSTPEQVQDTPRQLPDSSQVPLEHQNVPLPETINTVTNGHSPQDIAQPVSQVAKQTVSGPISSPTMFTPSAVQQQSPPTVGTPDVFIPYQPEGPAAQTRVPQNDLQWLPPNTATPAASKFGNLPVFTSTGAIPFGVKKEAEANDVSMGGVSTIETQSLLVKEEQTRKHDIWDVPDTPRQ